MFENKKAVIFDFDGTIADSVSLVLKICNQIAPEYQIKTVSNEEFQKVKQLPTQQMIKELDIPFWKVPQLVNRVQKELSKKRNELKIFDGIPEVIKALSSLGLTLGIISSNSAENISQVLKINQLDHFFSFIDGSPRLFGKHKRIQKVLTEFSIDSDDLIYIGDETRDIEAAKKCDVDIIAVCWGAHSKELLSQFDPDYLVDQPRDIIAVH